MRTVLITGAAGFVGSHLCAELLHAGHRVRAIVRRSEDRVRIGGSGSRRLDVVPLGSLSGETRWRDVLDGVDTVVHLAARVHVMKESAAGADSAYRDANVRVTERLAEQSVASGVRRLIFLSSVKVNGEATSDRPYSVADEPKPIDPYGVSKLEAEETLERVSATSALEYVIVRPPLVYGPGVRANFLRLLQLAESGLPLPLGAIRNRRSLVSVWNLCDFIGCVTRHPRAAGAVWFVADGEDLSTPDLVGRLAKAMGRPSRLLPVPERWLRWAGTAARRAAEVDRLCGSLQVDTTPARRELGWSPPLSVDESLEQTVRWYRERRAAA